MEPERVRCFLIENLPKANRKRVNSVIAKLEAISRCYQDERAARHRWDKREVRRLSPTDWPVGYLTYRRQCLASICRQSKTLKELIASLEPEIKTSFGSLRGLDRLEARATELLETEQSMGRPRDRARQRWVLAVARIYQQEFKKRPSVLGSNSGPSDKHGPFFLLLHLTAPKQAQQIDPKTIRRILSANLK